MILCAMPWVSIQDGASEALPPYLLLSFWSTLLTDYSFDKWAITWSSTAYIVPCQAQDFNILVIDSIYNSYLIGLKPD